MKVFSNSVTFNYTWEEVSTANWRKYCPWNEKSTHVVAVDTVSRAVDPDTGVLRTERLITCKQSAPDWLRSILGNALAESHVLETSWVDPRSRTVTMTSTNLTWSNLISVEETVVYRPLHAIDTTAITTTTTTDQPQNHKQQQPQQLAKTQFHQEARITALCGGWQRIKNRIEDTLVTRFHENAVKGREGFEAVLAMSRRVFAEEREREREKMLLPQ
jgi:hypothetical protein